MKHRVIFLAIAIVSISMVACGAKPTSAVTEEAMTETVEVESTTTEAITLRPAQQAILTDYENMLERYNKAVEAFNADKNLSAMEDLVKIGNEVTSALDQITPMMEGVADFTDEDIKTVREWMDDSIAYIDMLEGLVANYAGKESLVVIPVSITNQTGVDIQGLFMAPQSSETWGSDLLEEPFKSGESVETSMMITEDCKIWDLQASDSSGNELEFYGMDFSDLNTQEPIAVTLEAAEDGTYNLTIGSGKTEEKKSEEKKKSDETKQSDTAKSQTTDKQQAPANNPGAVAANANKQIVGAELEEVPNTVYEIGAGFQASDIKFRCIYSDGSTANIPPDQLTITANGTSIYEGYNFKQAGTKKVVIKYKDWVVDYKLEVVNNISDKKVDRCELYSGAKTLTYKVGAPFRADEIVIRCYYTDGTFEDFNHENIEFYVNNGQLKNGYNFKEAGNKTVNIKFMDYRGSFNITVTK